MRLGQFVVAIVVLAVIYAASHYLMPRAMQSLIASLPPTQKYVDAPAVDGSDCAYGLRVSRPSAASKPCRYEPNQWSPPEPKAPPQISEADAKNVAMWFASAGFLPLVLGGIVAVLGLWMLRAYAARAESRRAYAELERLAGLGPVRDPLDQN